MRQAKTSARSLFEKCEEVKEKLALQSKLGANKKGKRKAKLKVYLGLENTGYTAMKSHNGELFTACVSSDITHI